MTNLVYHIDFENISNFKPPQICIPDIIITFIITYPARMQMSVDIYCSTLVEENQRNIILNKVFELPRKDLCDDYLIDYAKSYKDTLSKSLNILVTEDRELRRRFDSILSPVLFACRNNRIYQTVDNGYKVNNSFICNLIEDIKRKDVDNMTYINPLCNSSSNIPPMTPPTNVVDKYDYSFEYEGEKIDLTIPRDFEAWLNEPLTSNFIPKPTRLAILKGLCLDLLENYSITPLFNGLILVDGDIYKYHSQKFVPYKTDKTEEQIKHINDILIYSEYIKNNNILEDVIIRKVNITQELQPINSVTDKYTVAVIYEINKDFISYIDVAMDNEMIIPILNLGQPMALTNSRKIVLDDFSKSLLKWIFKMDKEDDVIL